MPSNDIFVCIRDYLSERSRYIGDRSLFATRRPRTWQKPQHISHCPDFLG
jgi:hypothetical protein